MSARKSCARRRNANHSKSYELCCEWFDCNLVFDDLTLFLQHLHTTHIKSYANDDDDDVDDNIVTCQWLGCDHSNFQTYSHFTLHVSYHGFHQKLMSAGLSVMQELGDDINCYLDPSSRNVLPELPMMFVCGWKECFTEFVDTESFYQHVDTHAFDHIVIPALSRDDLKRTKYAKCEWINCDSSFTSKSHLREHLRSHTQQKLIACPSCGAMFCNKTKFVDHIYRQFPDAIKADQNSVMIQVTKNNEETTLLTIQMPQNRESSSILIQNPNSDSELMLLDLSDPSLASSMNNSSNASEMNESITNTSSNIKTYSCNFCYREFATQSLLREHSRRHINKYKCDKCELVTTSPSALRHHITYRHQEERPYSCQFCDFKFKSRSDLRRHIDTHNEEPQFKCPLCAFQSRCVHTFSKHHKEVHMDIKNEYICNECDKKFSRGNNLTRHLITIHKYSLPPGCSRFQYQKQEDGSYRLVTKTITAHCEDV